MNGKGSAQSTQRAQSKFVQRFLWCSAWPARRPRTRSIGDLTLVAAAATMQWVVFVALGLFAFGRIRRAIDALTRGCDRRPAAGDVVRRLRWAVETSSVLYVPLATCVTEAIAAVVLARCLGHDAHVEFGVKPPDGDTLVAHAWATSGEQTIVGGEAQGWLQLRPARTP